MSHINDNTTMEVAMTKRQGDPELDGVRLPKSYGVKWGSSEPNARKIVVHWCVAARLIAGDILRGVFQKRRMNNTVPKGTLVYAATADEMTQPVITEEALNTFVHDLLEQYRADNDLLAPEPKKDWGDRLVEAWINSVTAGLTVYGWICRFVKCLFRR